eukprot:TRINITY_DN13795_c0_g1_i1.p2 TRINITY_DN13795_c0_g1~~TRINITY_DN13795_c0_g1_i1.p2  ORF type:complete len:280 (-),score=36.92 TRINITY_DN13795_c0_g1_i1:1398-2237(-)
MCIRDRNKTSAELLHIFPGTPETKAWAPPPGFKARELSSDSLGKSYRVSSTSKIGKKLKKVLSPSRMESGSLRALDTTGKHDSHNKSERLNATVGRLFEFGSAQPKRRSSKSLSRSKAPKVVEAPPPRQRKRSPKVRYDKEATIELVGEEPRRLGQKSETHLSLDIKPERTRSSKLRGRGVVDSQEQTPETRSIDLILPETIIPSWSAQLAGRSGGNPGSTTTNDPTIPYRNALERLMQRTQRILAQYRSREEGWGQERSAYEARIKSLLARISLLEGK